MTTLRANQPGNSTTGSTATILLLSNYSSLRASLGHLPSTFCDRAFGYQPTFILRGWQAGEGSESEQPKQD